MSDFQYLLSGTGSPIALQAGFSRGVETVTPASLMFVPGSSVTFFLVPSGPMLFQTSGHAPAAAETLAIAESSDPGDIVRWFYAMANGATVRSFALPAGQLFKRFIPVNGPFIGLKILGASALTIQADGLIGWAPSTVGLGPMVLASNII
jgi:hypothetical protein